MLLKFLHRLDRAHSKLLDRLEGARPNLERPRPKECGIGRKLTESSYSIQMV